MYTKLGFLPKGIQIEKLTNLNDDTSSNDSSELDDDQIYENDMVIYAVKNTEELSYVEFHVRSIENDFFMHHDIFVTDTITAAEYIKLENTHFIATGGYENNVNLYDCFIYNPLDPQIQLKGHTDKINCIYIDNTLLQNNMLQSGSDDKQILKWDLCTIREIEREIKDFEVCKIVSNEVYCSKNGIHSNNYFFDNKCEIECVKLLDNSLYVSDEKGCLKMLDIRKEGIVLQKKIHDEALTGFEIINDEIVSVSLDELVIHSSKVNFEQKKVINSKNELFCISYNKDFEACICGGKKDELRFLDVHEK
ncbi:hypothetical protein BDAP_002301 [Binucleata daphniae]